MQVIRPILDSVLVELDPEPQMAGNIHLPENLRVPTREKGQLATVLAVGPGRYTRRGRLVRPEVEVGDHVLIRRFCGTELHETAQRQVLRRLAVLEPAHILGVVPA